MNTPIKTLVTIALLSTCLPLAADAQVAAPPPAPAGAPAPDAGEPLQLSPFKVNAAEDTSWRASSTLIGNRTNQELAKVPVTVDAITGEFMKDLDLTTLEDSARYVSGLTVSPQFESRTDDNRITYRGLNGTDTSSRNFFLWYVPVDTYNVERLDFNKGSNSLMFGNSAPGGQAASFTKQPRDHNFGNIYLSYGSFGTYRVQGDFNYALNDKLSMRLNLVDRSNRTYVDNNYQDLTAADLAISYRPWRNTEIRLEGETGKFERIRADNALAIRNIASSGRGFSTNNRWYYTSNGEIIQRTSTSPAAVDRNAGSGVVLSLLEGQSQGVTLPNGTAKAFTGFNKEFNVLGTGDYLDRDYDSFTATIDQSVGKLEMEFAYNYQKQSQKRNDVSFGGSSSPSIVEVDSTGRPYVDMDGGTTYKIFSTDANQGRFTAAYPFELCGWTKQRVVVNATREEILMGSRRFSLVNNAATGSLANNVVRVRAYLDDPNATSAAFWEKLLPENLPTTATFQPILNEVYVNTGPVWDKRYSGSANITLSGEYFGGRLLSLLGTGQNEIKRKIPIDSVYTPDARGVYTLIGDPDESPDKYRYDSTFDMKARTSMAGLTYVAFDRPDFSVNIYGVYSESFNWQSATTFDGKALGPITGDTVEFGLKGDFWKKRVFFTLAGYKINRANAAYAWTPDLLTNVQLEDLFNPNNLTPSSPDYFAVTTGLNNERRTVNSKEEAKGFDFTLQTQRVHGLQARVTFSKTDVAVTRDFADFQEKLAAAIARTAAAQAPGGTPSMAENATLIANGQNILLSNTNTTETTGLRSAPYAASWTLDYELPRRLGLRFGITGVWVPDYNVAILNGVPYRAGGSHLVDLYALYTRKFRDVSTTFRLGVRNAYDLTNGDSDYRKTSSLSTNSAGQPNYLYRYTEPVAVSFSTTLAF